MDTTMNFDYTMGSFNPIETEPIESQPSSPGSLAEAAPQTKNRAASLDFDMFGNDFMMEQDLFPMFDMDLDGERANNPTDNFDVFDVNPIVYSSSVPATSSMPMAMPVVEPITKGLKKTYSQTSLASQQSVWVGEKPSPAIKPEPTPSFMETFGSLDSASRLSMNQPKPVKAAKKRSKSVADSQSKAASRKSKKVARQAVKSASKRRKTITQVETQYNVTTKFPTRLRSTRIRAAAEDAQRRAVQAHSMIFNGEFTGDLSTLEQYDAHGNKIQRIGAYTLDERRKRIARFHAMRKRRVWSRKIKYSCRKKLAEGRPRVKGRFVKTVEEGLPAPVDAQQDIMPFEQDTFGTAGDMSLFFAA